MRAPAVASPALISHLALCFRFNSQESRHGARETHEFSDWRRPSLFVLLAGLLPAVFAVVGTLRADDDSAESGRHESDHSDVSGKTYESVELKKMAPGKIPGTFVRLTIVNADTGKEITLWAKTVKEVSSADGTVQLAYDSVSKTLAPTGPRQAGRDPAAGQGRRPCTDAEGPHTKAKTPRRGKRGAQDADSTPVDPKEAEAKRQEIFKKTGVWMWPELTAEQQAAELAKRKEFIKRFPTRFPI